MKYYILGATGFMGSGMVDYLKSKGHEVFSERIDITDYPSLLAKFESVKPDVVINFAGVRAYPNIDWCEDHKEGTVQVNVGGAINVALASLKVGAYPIQIASGCIYSGGLGKKFKEEDEPNFSGSFYSRMRIVMQNALKELPVLQVRIRMPISKFSHPRNFINKIVSYDKVISVANSVTLIEDMYPALELLTESRPTGVLNLVNEGYLTHSDVLNVYNEIVDPDHEYETITLDELQGEGGITKAKRSNCILSTKKAKSLGVKMPALDEERLKEIMISFKKSKEV